MRKKTKNNNNNNVYKNLVLNYSEFETFKNIICDLKSLNKFDFNCLNNFTKIRINFNDFLNDNFKDSFIKIKINNNFLKWFELIDIILFDNVFCLSCLSKYNNSFTSLSEKLGNLYYFLQDINNEFLI